MLNGGYVMVSRNDTNIYEKLNRALTIGKPVLFYEDANTCYYIDTIAKSGDDIILTKGGKTFTITDANAVSSTGEIQNHLYQHNICIVGESGENTLYASITIINNSPIKFDDLELVYDYIRSNFNSETNNNLLISGCLNNIGLVALWSLSTTYSVDALNFRTVDDDNYNLDTLTSINDKVILLF